MKSNIKNIEYVQELETTFFDLLQKYKNVVYTHDILVNHLDQYDAQEYIRELEFKYNINLK
jgi:hypothetical protein